MYNRFNVSRETFERIEIYKQILTQWNPKINLVSPSTLNDLDNRHILDALALDAYISKLDTTNDIYDLGSGNGVPGILISAAGKSNMTLIESDARKCSFLQEVKFKLDLSVNIICGRVENTVFLKDDIVISRGFATIKKTASLVSRETYTPRMILLKGRNYLNELLELSSESGYIYSKENYIDDRYIVDILASKEKIA